MPNTLQQQEDNENLMLTIQGLHLLTDKVKLNKSIIELDGNKHEDNRHLITSYNKTLLRIEILKLAITKKIVESLND